MPAMEERSACGCACAAITEATLQKLRSRVHFTYAILELTLLQQPVQPTQLKARSSVCRTFRGVHSH